jgi:hypothetical protein
MELSTPSNNLVMPKSAIILIKQLVAQLQVAMQDDLMIIMV